MEMRTIEDLPIVKAWDGVEIRELLRDKTNNGELPYSISNVRVLPGMKSPLHGVEGRIEIYLVVAGEGRVDNGQEKRSVKAPCTVFIKPGETQSVENTGDTTLEIYCIVSPPWDEKAQVMR